MTIIVEDGQQLDLVSPLPNSFASVANFRKYFETDRFDEVVGDADDEQIELALLKGAAYMRQKWRLEWRGSLVRGFQPMDWPRRGVPVPDFFDPFKIDVQTGVPIAFQDTLFIPTNLVPREVVEAQMLLAHATIDDNGLSTITLQEMLGGRTAKREKLGPLEIEYMGAADGTSAERLTNVYWDAFKTIEPYLDPSQPWSATVVRG